MTIPLAIYGLIMTFKEEKMIFSGHRDYLVIYHETRREQCDIYYLSEIKRWTFRQRLFNPSVTLFLHDGKRSASVAASVQRFTAILEK